MNRVLFLTSDLVFPSRVKAITAAHGAELRVVTKLSALDSALAEGNAALVILDLSSPAADPQEAMALLNHQSAGAPPIVAFGPHVHEQRLQAARDAGCVEVVTRGQFNAAMDEVVGRYLRSGDI